MSTLRTIRKLLFGETWLLPIGLAITLAAGDIVRPLASNQWPRLGGLILLAAVLVLLLTSVHRSAHRR